MALNIGSPSYRNYQGSTKGMGKTIRQLSSGYRINSAADDAAGLAISQKLRTQITADQARLQNTQMEISAAQTGDGALSSVHSALGRMRELATQAANGTYTDADRGMLQKEFSQLRSQIGNVFEGTDFNGNPLLSGDLNLDGLSIGTQDGASAAMDALSGAIDALSGQRADFGAQQNRAEYTTDGLWNAMIQTQDAESEIRDLDIALAAMELSKKKILGQSSLFMMAQARQNAMGVMKLLYG
ncbi:MAG: flagellin [Oscillospiraceae bacterium]|nr:flagellin [Oscillospiraceae bacterium]